MSRKQVLQRQILAGVAILVVVLVVVGLHEGRIVPAYRGQRRRPRARSASASGTWTARTNAEASMPAVLQSGSASSCRASAKHSWRMVGRLLAVHAARAWLGRGRGHRRRARLGRRRRRRAGRSGRRTRTPCGHDESDTPEPSSGAHGSRTVSCVLVPAGTLASAAS